MSEDEPESGIPDLSSEELTDLVVVERVMSAPQAAFTVTILEEAGIPAVVRGEQLSGLTGGLPSVDVCVPRKLRIEAEELLLKSREEAQEKGVQSAFSSPHEVEDEDEIGEESDPVFQRMINIASLPLDRRNAELRQHVFVWLNEHIGAVYMARYLAAAGLSRDEANSLVEDVKESRAFTEAREAQRTSAYAYIILGLVIFVFSAAASLITGDLRFISVTTPVAVGLAMLFNATRKLASLAPKESLKEKPPQ